MRHVLAQFAFEKFNFALGVLLHATKQGLCAFERAELGVRVTKVDALRAGVSNFADAFEQADVDGALAASVFHSGAIAIPALKRYLRERQIEVRDVQ